MSFGLFLHRLVLICAVAAILFSADSSRADESPESTADDPAHGELDRRTQHAQHLEWLRDVAGPHPWLNPGISRADILERKRRALGAGDPRELARANGVLAAEAQVRASRVLDRWLERIDFETGLLPRGVAARDRIWDYADTGADLYPHLLIAARLLRPDAVQPLTQVLSAEQRVSGGQRLPDNVDLSSDRPNRDDVEDRMYGTVEYAKDGLLPLLERLGPGPWLDRLSGLGRVIAEDAPVQTRFGPIPGDGGEVNGQAMQVFVRLYWATGDDSYRQSAVRLARAYLELALPDTEWIPARTWDFSRERSNTANAQLRDHGNEIVAGLVEHHLVETALGAPEAAVHRPMIRSMLDHLLDRGLTREGLWKSAIDFETGESLKDTLSDNWGYLFAAYLTQAMTEESWSGGDAERARRYRAASETGLRAASRLELYPWQGVEQDGYADTIESALYLLNRIPSREGAAWVDRQAATLFGAQSADGRVEDRYLDGNFVRTALLYAAWQTQGFRPDPWEPGLMIGAAPDGPCVVVALASARDWRGRLLFDTPRHRLHLHLPINYPRLNEWPEWFAADPARAYRVDDSAATHTGTLDGRVLSAGLAMDLSAGAERQLRICPA